MDGEFVMDDIKALKKRAKKDPEVKNKNHAKYLIGMYYKNGFTVKEDKSKAMNYFIDLSYAYEPAKEERLGLLIEGRNSVYNYSYIEKNCNEVVKYNKKKENPNGYSYMAEMYLVFSESRLALDTLKLAEEKGSTKCYYVWGKVYSDGEVVKKDEKKAFEYFTKSAESKDYRGQRELGICYMLGKGCDKDVNKAIEYLELASVVGDRDARINLAQCIIENKVEDKYNDAIYLLKTFDKKYYGAYKWCEALRHFNGVGVKKNPMKGFKLLEKEFKFYVSTYNLPGRHLVEYVLEKVETGELKLSSSVVSRYKKTLRDIEKEENKAEKETQAIAEGKTPRKTSNTSSFGSSATHYHLSVEGYDTNSAWYFEAMHTFGRCPSCGYWDMKRSSKTHGRLYYDAMWTDEYGISTGTTFRMQDPYGQTTTTHYTCKKCNFEWETEKHELIQEDSRDALFGKTITDTYSTLTISHKALKQCNAEVTKRIKSFNGKYKYKKYSTKV